MLVYVVLAYVVCNVYVAYAVDVVGVDSSSESSSELNGE